MNTLPGLHDPNLIDRTPVPQDQFTEAWRAATNEGKDDPALRHPGARVGSCRHCGGSLVPAEPPAVHGLVRWFYLVCAGRCDGGVQVVKEVIPRLNPSAAAAVQGYVPGGGR